MLDWTTGLVWEPSGRRRLRAAARRDRKPPSHEFRESPAAPSQSELSRCGTQLVGCVRAHPRLAAGSTSNYGHTLPVILNIRIPISNIFSFIFCVYFSPGGSVYVTAQLTMALPVLPQLSTSFLPSSAPPSQRLVEDLSGAFFSLLGFSTSAVQPRAVSCFSGAGAPNLRPAGHGVALAAASSVRAGRSQRGSAAGCPVRSRGPGSGFPVSLLGGAPVANVIFRSCVFRRVSYNFRTT